MISEGVDNLTKMIRLQAYKLYDKFNNKDKANSLLK